MMSKLLSEYGPAPSNRRPSYRSMKTFPGERLDHPYPSSLGKSQATMGIVKP